MHFVVQKTKATSPHMGRPLHGLLKKAWTVSFTGCSSVSRFSYCYQFSGQNPHTRFWILVFYGVFDIIIQCIFLNIFYFILICIKINILIFFVFNTNILKLSENIKKNFSLILIQAKNNFKKHKKTKVKDLQPHSYS